jgi:drug/metabolite transporter (DMT)-like permease
MKIPKLLNADLALILITLIWGSAFTIVKQSLAQVSPVLFIALRFWVATAVVLIFVPGTIHGITRATLRRGMILAVALLGGFMFQTIGLRGTSPSRSAFITSLSVVLVPILGMLVFGHRPKPRTLAGVALASVGLGFLTLNNLELKFGRGETMTLLCAVFFAMHILMLARYLREHDYRHLVLIQLAGSALLGTILVPLLETPFIVWDAQFTFNFLFTAVLATGFAFYVQNRAQQYTTANRAALIFSLEPFFAALVAYWLLGHSLTGKEWFGGVLVLGGILISELHRK